jgi:hypothetical protein
VRFGTNVPSAPASTPAWCLPLKVFRFTPLTALRAAIEAAPVGSSSSFALSGPVFDCDYDQEIFVLGKNITVVGTEHV